MGRKRKYCSAQPYLDYIGVSERERKMKKNEYICDLCKGVFKKAWTDKEAEAEYRKMFKTECIANIGRAIVCDDCYKHIRAG